MCKEHKLEKLENTEHRIRDPNVPPTLGKLASCKKDGVPMKSSFKALEINPAGRTGRAGLAVYSVKERNKLPETGLCRLAAQLAKTNRN